ncbi:hypothetical protein [Cognaticolwellia mytili]|uniref:hypothetical protein n=1 Tax=Cognaticolwellia mytili TaxID=1888913 RepID=UPI000A170F0D|nr:hypothetical protein [Cognaticolwellia mytili]
MENNHFIIARTLHVIAVVLWIGGVAFVTTILIPAIRNSQSAENRLNLFEVLEGKFSFQAKLTTLVTGLSGFYMLHIMNTWSSMQWWVYLMIFIWSVFSVVLFLLEPLFLHKWFHRQAKINDERTFLVLQVMHIVLLSISLIAIFSGVAGVHGLFY